MILLVLLALSGYVILIGLQTVLLAVIADELRKKNSDN